MKKIYIQFMILAAMVVVGAAMTSCQKEEAITGKFTMTVNATKGGSNSKALSEGTNTINASWAEGEEVKVYHGETLLGTLRAQSAGVSTTLVGEIEDDNYDNIEQNDVLTLKFCSPNYATQDGTLTGNATSIDKVCDYAEATVQVTSVGNGKLRTGNADFENKQAIVKFTLQNASSSAINATSLVVSVGANSYTVTPASGTSELYVAIPGFSGQTVSLTATDGSDTYTYERSGVTFNNGEYYNISVEMAILGKFSVASGTKVYFAPGNLQAAFAEAHTSSCTWQFAPTQYSFIGNNIANTAIGDNQVTTAGTVDLFGWVGATSDLAAYGINNDNTNSNYGSTANEDIKSDWCVVANAANLGGHNDWHTPTYDEWYYLFNTRTNAIHKYGMGQVNGVNGLILLPDTWTLPAGLSFKPGNKSYTTNPYTIADWQKMEKNGAVFLPAAGRRVTNGLFDTTHGFYWSSTAWTSNGSYAYDINFEPFNFTVTYKDRSYGHSVRLVRTVN